MKLVDRKDIPARWRVEAHAREGGRCYVCQARLPLKGPGVEYDHRAPLWLSEDAHRPENIYPICTTPCHRDKSAAEAPIRAKIVRLLKRERGEVRSKRAIGTRALQSRPFDPRPPRD